MAEPKGFLVYGDLADTLAELSDEEAGVLFKAMMAYFVSEQEPDLPRDLRFAFIPVRQQMDRDREKYDRRCEKNSENIRKRWNKKDTNEYDRIRTYTNDTNTNTKTNTKTNTNTNTNAADVTAESCARSVVSHLNEKAGSRYRVTDTVLEQVEDLIGAGYTEADMITVIDKKCSDWIQSDDMRRQLRPSVLLGQHFEEYLNAPASGDAALKQQEAERKARHLKAKEEQRRREEEIEARYAEEFRKKFEEQAKRTYKSVGG